MTTIHSISVSGNIGYAVPVTSVSKTPLFLRNLFQCLVSLSSPFFPFLPKKRVRIHLNYNPLNQAFRGCFCTSKFSEKMSLLHLLINRFFTIVNSYIGFLKKLQQAFWLIFDSLPNPLFFFGKQIFKHYRQGLLLHFPIQSFSDIAISTSSRT